jgi:hypothetical protein
MKTVVVLINDTDFSFPSLVQKVSLLSVCTLSWVLTTLAALCLSITSSIYELVVRICDAPNCGHHLAYL